ncbi:MAG: 50S ribosomal protein L11 methyltransferase [Bacteroidales bacterium]|nr:50S ribosomal protein L11 methyltransferase [Lentimicrobiaceae bacterium]MDD5696102.1 50S ribosomal protein L11 methyltransferase [Bacteroidales bacterium]
MDYVEVTCHVPISQEAREIVTSVLASLGFEGFLEEADELMAYIPADKYNPGLLDSIRFTGDQPLSFQYSVRTVAEQNWNQQWESSYEPVLIGDSCQVRAPFHQTREGITYDIVIEPRMSFGTAHHDTTKLMIEALLQLDVKGKHVLDMGCGTGVLAILADKMGAVRVIAVDHDPWAYSNALDNIQKNNTTSCSVYLGEASAAGIEEFDLILANINRNTLLKDMSLYARGLRNNGLLIVSGFYRVDTDILRQEAKANELKMDHLQLSGDWALIQFIKDRIP